MVFKRMIGVFVFIVCGTFALAFCFSESVWIDPAEWVESHPENMNLPCVNQHVLIWYPRCFVCGCRILQLPPGTPLYRGLYDWSNDIIYLADMSDTWCLLHELTHRYQNLALKIKIATLNRIEQADQTIDGRLMDTTWDAGKNLTIEQWAELVPVLEFADERLTPAQQQSWRWRLAWSYGLYASGWKYHAPE